jgi:acyl-homoserine-lactone acylase
MYLRAWGSTAVTAECTVSNACLAGSCELPHAVVASAITKPAIKPRALCIACISVHPRLQPPASVLLSAAHLNCLPDFRIAGLSWPQYSDRKIEGSVRVPIRVLLIALLTALAFLPTASCGAGVAAADFAHWQAEAQAVTIVRDDWGIAHIRGTTDADAVFGMMYAQAEDDFNRIETNYLNALGRLAEAEGESAIYKDLRMKMFIEPADLKQRYLNSPSWLKALMDAWADGLNYFLATHTQVAPRIITRFEPWMALSFTEGSIGGDIERISLTELQSFYAHKRTASGHQPTSPDEAFREPSGSNGIAIAPANTINHHALLLINPHTSFFFRSEVKVESAQGLNVYGAVTWGQMFVYQGFNAHCGWMHTSTGADTVDEFAEDISEHAGHLYYRHGDRERRVSVANVTIPYRSSSGMAARQFVVYRTPHGPIVREAGGKWISIALMFKPVEALSQSFLRTKARDYQSFLEVAKQKANSSNNTIFADAAGNIAYLHPQFIPRRDDRFDYTKPVDGSNPAADWNGLHSLEQTPHLLNPANGWIANTNNWPYSAAGAHSPDPKNYPRYMDSVGENQRGLHAALILKDRKDFTIQRLMAGAFDSYLPAFGRLIPDLVRTYDQTPATDPVRSTLADQLNELRGWDDRWSATSVATTLAVLWGERLWQEILPAAQAAGLSPLDYMLERAPAEQKLRALQEVSDRLTNDFGSWRTPWGDINRFQRVSGDIVQTFDDAEPSTPVPFTSSEWGSLASFGARRYEGSKRYYGTSGNSFVAVVEFGEQVHALAVTAGGESADPASAHFNDEAERYAAGNLREVYFYDAQLTGHTERTYHPGA